MSRNYTQLSCYLCCPRATEILKSMLSKSCKSLGICAVQCILKVSSRYLGMCAIQKLCYLCCPKTKALPSMQFKTYQLSCYLHCSRATYTCLAICAVQKLSTCLATCAIQGLHVVVLLLVLLKNYTPLSCYMCYQWAIVAVLSVLFQNLYTVILPYVIRQNVSAS